MSVIQPGEIPPSSRTLALTHIAVTDEAKTRNRVNHVGAPRASKSVAKAA
jgi:hypothetical protein